VTSPFRGPGTSADVILLPAQAHRRATRTAVLHSSRPPCRTTRRAAASGSACPLAPVRRLGRQRRLAAGSNPQTVPASPRARRRPEDARTRSITAWNFSAAPSLHGPLQARRCGPVRLCPAPHPVQYCSFFSSCSPSARGSLTGKLNTVRLKSHGRRDPSRRKDFQAFAIRGSLPVIASVVCLVARAASRLDKLFFAVSPVVKIRASFHASIPISGCTHRVL